MRVAGLDLAASPSRCSGYVSLNLKRRLEGELLTAKCLGDDNEIINEVVREEVAVVAIDAPIAPEPTMRDVDRKMISLGYRVFPPTFSHMRELTRRGWGIYYTLRSMGVAVIETHPRSALLSGGYRDPYEAVHAMGVRVGVRLAGKDLEDALVAALVAAAYVWGVAERVWGSDGVIYLLPKYEKLST